jgi:branched-chain amino acid transport system permease protein
MSATSQPGLPTPLGARVRGVVGRVPNAAEGAVLAAMVLTAFLLPKGLPSGVAGLGVVQGAALALQAIGVVLVFRSDRFINFAQVSFGATGALLFTDAIQFGPLYRWANDACPPCIDQPGPAWRQVNFWLFLVAALAMSAALAWASYAFVIRRFRNAPRLVVTVATIFLNQLLLAVGGIVTHYLTTPDQRAHPSVPVRPELPWHLTVSIAPAIFHLEDVIAVAVAGLAAALLVLYLRGSATGMAIRASAENRTRAETLGIRAEAVTARVWLLAGLLSGVAAVIGSMSTAANTSDALTSTGLVRVLLIATLARFTSIGMTVVASVIVGVLQAATQWSFSGSSSVLDGTLVVIIAVVLLLQRRTTSRAEVEASAGWQATREIRPVPRELRSVPVVRSWTRWLIAGICLALLGVPWAMPANDTNLAALAVIYAIVGLSLLVLTGWAGQISLGQFGLCAVGAYIAGISGLPFLLAVPFGAVGGAAAAALLGIPALKLRGLHLAVITLAFAVAVPTILLSPAYLGSALPQSVDRPSVLGLDLNDQRTFYYICLGCLAVVALAVLAIRRSRTGRVLIAARDNESAVQSFGVSIVRARLAAFALSGFLAALAGALLAYQEYGVKAENFPADRSLTLFLMTVIGGLGGVSGPLIGAAYQGTLLMTALSSQVVSGLDGIGGLALLLFLPGGLAQGAFDIRDAVLRRVAQRNRIVVPSLFEDRRVHAGREVAPLLPKARPGGGTTFVPLRYTLDGQWALPTAVAVDDERSPSVAQPTGARS